MPETTRRWLHLAVKEWRPARGWIVFAWAAVASLWLHPTWSRRDAPDMSGLAHFLLAEAMVLLAVSRLFQADVLWGTTSFWMTRPIGGAELLRAKVLVCLTAVIVPCSLITTVPLVFASVSVPSRDLVLVTVGNLLSYAALCMAVAVAGALTRGMPSFAGAAMALALLWVLGLLLRAVGWLTELHRWRTLRWQPTLQGAAVYASRNVVLALFLVLASGWVLRKLSRTRSRRTAFQLVALALVVALTLDWAWRIDLLRPMLPRAQDTQVPRVELETPPRPLDAVRVPGATVFAAGFHVQGLPAGTVLEQAGYETTASVGGRERRVRQDVRPAHPLGETFPPAAEVALACRWLPGGRSPSWEVFRSSTDAPSLSDLRGRLSLSLLRPRVVARAAVSPGGVLAAPGLRVEVVGASHGWPPSQAGVEVRLMRVSLPLFGDPSDGRPSRALLGDALASRRTRLLFHHPARHECHELRALGYSSRTAGVPLAIFDLRLAAGVEAMVSETRVEEHAIVPIGWLSGAELVLLSADEIGVVDVPFALPAVQPTREARP